MRVAYKINPFPGAEITTAATVYPKITQKSNQTITCKINSDIAGTVEIAIYNLNGQLMYRQNQTVI